MIPAGVRGQESTPLSGRPDGDPVGVVVWPTVLLRVITWPGAESRLGSPLPPGLEKENPALAVPPPLHLDTREGVRVTE